MAASTQSKMLKKIVAAAHARAGKGGPGLLDKVGGAIKGVLGAPGTLIGNGLEAMADAKAKNASTDAGIMQTARNSAGAPQFNQDGSPTDAFKYQTMADGIKQKLQQAKQPKQVPINAPVSAPVPTNNTVPPIKQVPIGAPTSSGPLPTTLPPLPPVAQARPSVPLDPMVQDETGKLKDTYTKQIAKVKPTQQPLKSSYLKEQINSFQK